MNEQIETEALQMINNLLDEGRHMFEILALLSKATNLLAEKINKVNSRLDPNITSNELEGN